MFIKTWKTIEGMEHNLKAYVDLGRHWNFQQDNDPKHTTHIVQVWLSYNASRRLNTPPQSSRINGLNIFETF